MSTKAFRLISFLFVIFLAVSAAGFEFLVSAQEPTNQNTAADTSTKKTTTSRRRRGRRHKAATSSEGTAVPSTELIASASSIETSEQTDLSGTYTGTFECADAGLTGPTTLTVTGNQFTTADGKSGRIVATTTRGYTGVAMQFGEVVMPAPGQPGGPPPTIVSMHAKKSGDRLMLTTVPGAAHVCSFTPAGAVGRTRHRKARAATPAMTAEPAMPDATMGAATPAEPAMPARPSRRRGRRGTRTTNMNTNTSTNDNTGATEGTATPTPTPNVPRN
ncbi:MAG TPA: hypothetical protein DC047_19530 [Blastocatellia bacterium]|nr:hypothetical protein [Blastocatellia bacterium]